MSYSMQKYIPIEQGTPGWQFSPVPTWGGNPLNAGPRRVGVGCGPTGCGCGGCGVGADDPYKTVGWGMVAAGAAAALIVGLIVGNAAGKKKYAANARRRRAALARNSPTRRLKSTAYGGRWQSSEHARTKEEALGKRDAARAAGAKRTRVVFSRGHQGEHPHYKVLIAR